MKVGFPMVVSQYVVLETQVFSSAAQHMLLTTEPLRTLFKTGSVRQSTWPETQLPIQATLEFDPLLFIRCSAGIIGVCHYTWPQPLFSKNQMVYSSLHVKNIILLLHHSFILSFALELRIRRVGAIAWWQHAQSSVPRTEK